MGNWDSYFKIVFLKENVLSGHIVSPLSIQNLLESCKGTIIVEFLSFKIISIGLTSQ